METQMTPTPAPWIDIARAEIGVHEVSGPAANSRILEYFGATTLRANTDEFPWCSAFVNWCLQHAGIPGTRSAAASSWRTWGAACTPQIGCIVVVQYDVTASAQITNAAIANAQITNAAVSAGQIEGFSVTNAAITNTAVTAGFHVGFLLRLDDTHVHVLGGNQSDQVKESAFPLASYRVVATRWPSEKKAA
jgi:uncharacterized protein (TIGR02594 family)